jgi:hypothetical protein
MLYKLENEYPTVDERDTYVFEAPTNQIAALACYTLDSYRFVSEDRWTSPANTYGDLSVWYERTYLSSLEDGIEHHKSLVANALASVTYGDFTDFRLYKMALKTNFHPVTRKKFIDLWHSRCIEDTAKLAWDKAQTLRNEVNPPAHKGDWPLPMNHPFFRR